MNKLFNLFWLAAFPAALSAQAEDRLIAAHGADKLNEVHALRFTFNVERDGELAVSRTWQWEPDSNKVVYIEGDEAPVRYDRDELDSADEATVAVDKKFINDSFWAFWPVHLSWSDNEEIKEMGRMKAPISEQEVMCVSIQYPSEEGGYTPGDRYDLYLRNFRPIEWTFHRGGAEEPSLVNTFEDYHKLGPLFVAAHHANADGSFRLYFTDLAWMDREGGQWMPGKVLKY